MGEKLKVLDLFSGIGGFSLGLERTGGFETVAFCEIEPFCQKVLKKHWPTVPVYEDVREINKIPSDVQLVTAGFPCQDISLAGTGAGLSGERSGLFWEIMRAVCVVGRPRLLLENVANLLNRGLSEILGALACIGYDAQWDCIRAAQVGLPHERNRIFIVANPDSMWELQSSWCIGNEWGWIHDSFQGPTWPLPNEGGDMPIDGVSQKLLGNSLVPQIPEIIGRAILKATR